MAIVDKIRKAKEKVERKAAGEKADKRASSRRVEKRKPKTSTEKAKVAKKEATELGGALKEYGSTKAPDFDSEALGGLSERAGQIGAGAESVIQDSESGDLDMFDMDSGNGGSMDDALDPLGLNDDMDGGMDDLEMDLDDF